MKIGMLNSLARPLPIVPDIAMARHDDAQRVAADGLMIDRLSGRRVLQSCREVTICDRFPRKEFRVIAARCVGRTRFTVALPAIGVCSRHGSTADQGRTGRKDSSSRLWHLALALGTHAKLSPSTGHSAVGLRRRPGNRVRTPRPHFTAPSCTLGNQVIGASDGAPFRQERRPTHVWLLPEPVAEFFFAEPIRTRPAADGKDCGHDRSRCGPCCGLPRLRQHRDLPLRPGQWAQLGQKDKAKGLDKHEDRLKRATVDIGAVIDFASSFGTLVLTRAYADWSAEVNTGYREQLVGRAVDLVQLFPAAAYGKNGADIRLAVDAVEDMFRLPDLTHVVIVAGDSDYIPLAQRCNG